MTKVHPSATAVETQNPSISGAVEVLTVWRKSLLFNCDGFTVFNAQGNLVFRVDNYSSASRTEVVLMDATGVPLLTLRRKVLSFGDHWRVFEGETAVNPRFSVRKNVTRLRSKALAHVTHCSRAVYEVEGSYGRRRCEVYGEGRRRVVAEIRPKVAAGAGRGVALGDDVFQLVVQPGFDASVAMAIVIVLEQMFRSRGA